VSRYHGNHEECPGCELTYGKFRTGLTYDEVRKMLWDNSPDRDDWSYKRRGTILGSWHAMKKQLWERHVEGCYDPEVDAIVDRYGEEVPF